MMTGLVHKLNVENTWKHSTLKVCVRRAELMLCNASNMNRPYMGRFWKVVQPFEENNVCLLNSDCVTLAYFTQCNPVRREFMMWCSHCMTNHSPQSGPAITASAVPTTLPWQICWIVFASLFVGLMEWERLLSGHSGHGCINSLFIPGILQLSRGPDIYIMLCNWLYNGLIITGNVLPEVCSCWLWLDRNTLVAWPAFSKLTSLGLPCS